MLVDLNTFFWSGDITGLVLRPHTIVIACTVTFCSLITRLLPRKTGREPGRSDHVVRDILCVVLDVVLIIKLLSTQYILSIKNAT